MLIERHSTAAGANIEDEVSVAGSTILTRPVSFTCSDPRKPCSRRSCSPAAFGDWLERPQFQASRALRRLARDPSCPRRLSIPAIFMRRRPEHEGREARDVLLLLHRRRADARTDWRTSAL